jgi:hypothetical protein
VPANAIDGDEGQRRWEDAGRPMIPSLLVDGDALPLHHPSQIASILGSPPTEDVASVRPVLWDTVTILDDFVQLVRSASWEQILIPTPFRDRSTRNLTVNVFRPFQMLPETWVSHRFDWWGGEADLQQEALLRSKDALLDWASRIGLDWRSFVLDHEDAIAAGDPMIGSNRGDVTYSTLLVTHRFHGANHHRQVRDVLSRNGVDVSARLRTEAMSDIGLPPELY